MEGLSKVSIDTLFIVAKLSMQALEELSDNIRFEYNYVRSSSFNYIIISSDPCYRVYLEPRYGTHLHLNGSYNIMIHLHKDAIESKPALIKYLMSIGDWKVKLIHIAYDWGINLSRHFVYKSDNIKVEKRKDTDNYYLYSKKSNPSIAYVYDKKTQLFEKKGISIPEEHLTRFEIRIKPRLKNSPLNNLVWLKKHMDKFVFIPDCEDITRALTLPQDKEIFKKVRRRESQNWKDISKRSKERIRDVSRALSVKFHDIFLEKEIYKDVAWQ